MFKYLLISDEESSYRLFYIEYFKILSDKTIKPPLEFMADLAVITPVLNDTLLKIQISALPIIEHAVCIYCYW